jgi:hypothetical protein
MRKQTSAYTEHLPIYNALDFQAFFRRSRFEESLLCDMCPQPRTTPYMKSIRSTKS